MNWSDFVKKLLIYNGRLEEFFDYPSELTISDLVTVTTAKSLLDRWLNNISLNYSSILKSDSIEFLLDTEEKEYAIVIGNGPSLQNIDFSKLSILLEEIDDIVVIACSAVLKRLLKENVKIDYLVFLDSGDNEYNFIKGVEKQTTKIPAFMEIAISPLVVKNYQGKKYFYVSYCPEHLVPNLTHILTKLTKKLSISTCGNTGGCAYIFASYLAKNIVLQGLDLSWENESQFRDYYDDTKKERLFKFEKGYQGKNYVVDSVFLAYKNCMLSWAKELYRSTNKKTYNLSRGGIFYGEHVLTEKDIDNRWHRIFR